MLFLLISAAFLLYHSRVDCSNSTVETGQDVSPPHMKLSYVNDRLCYLHRAKFNIFWSLDLQKQAEEHRDRLASFDLAKDVDFFVKLGAGTWLLSMTRNPVVIRMIADEYIVRKENLIRYLIDFNILDVGTIGCALYHSGTVGKIFCIYGFA